MNAEVFYEQVLNGVDMSPGQRHRHFTKLHTSALNDYVRAVRFTVVDLAEQPALHTDDPRTLKLIVAHMAEWDRFAIEAACDILAGMARPRLVQGFHGYTDHEGKSYDFESITAFNQFLTQRYQHTDWLEVQRLAIDLAESLHALFTTPKLLTPKRLEATASHALVMKSGAVLPELSMGWNLWIMVLEHMAVQHAIELRLS